MAWLAPAENKETRRPGNTNAQVESVVVGDQVDRQAQVAKPAGAPDLRRRTHIRPQQLQVC